MQEPQKILLIRLSSIGDILLTTPLLRLLHRRFPQAQIDFVVKEQFRDLLRCDPAIGTLYTLASRAGFSGLTALRAELHAQNYDLVVDVHNNWRSRFLCLGLKGGRVVRYRKYAWQRFLLIRAKIDKYPGEIPVHRRYLDTVRDWGIADDGQGLQIALDPTDRQQAQLVLQQNGYRLDELQLGFAPGAGMPTKIWPAEYFALLAERCLRQANVRIWLFGNQADRDAAERICRVHPDRIVDMTGKFTLMQTSCALAAMQGLVCNDSGLMHLATAVKCPVLAIFGPTTRQFGFYPQGSQVKVIEHEHLDCRPCSAYGSKRCPRNHFRCMREIDPLRVYEMVEPFFHLI